MNMISPLEAEHELVLLPIGQLRPTEEINIDRAECLASLIEETGYWTNPVLVEHSCSLVMDGNHRRYCADRLQLSRVPSVVLTYEYPQLSVTSWCDNLPYDVAKIFHAGLSGELLRFKSTRHKLAADLPDCRIALDDLR